MINSSSNRISPESTRLAPTTSIMAAPIATPAMVTPNDPALVARTHIVDLKTACAFSARTFALALLCPKDFKVNNP